MWKTSDNNRCFSPFFMVRFSFYHLWAHNKEKEDGRNRAMASLKQIAEKAGVSIPTVSRILAGSGYVSEEAAQRIRESIRELGYPSRSQ